ncbi:hypothetical protein CQA86_32630, partial [Klebsiella pneumoniae]
PYTQVLLGSRPKEGLKKGDALHCIPGARRIWRACRPADPYTQVLLGSRPKEGLKKGDALHCIPGARRIWR